MASLLQIIDRNKSQIFIINLLILILIWIPSGSLVDIFSVKEFNGENERS